MGLNKMSVYFLFLMGEESGDCILWGLLIFSNKKGWKIWFFDVLAVLFFLKIEFFFQIVDVSVIMLEVFVIYDVDLQINVGFDIVDDQFLQCIFYVGNCYVMVFIVVNQFIDY